VFKDLKGFYDWAGRYGDWLKRAMENRLKEGTTFDSFGIITWDLFSDDALFMNYFEFLAKGADPRAPEPMTLILSGLGLVYLVAYYRKKRWNVLSD